MCIYTILDFYECVYMEVFHGSGVECVLLLEKADVIIQPSASSI